MRDGWGPWSWSLADLVALGDLDLSSLLHSFPLSHSSSCFLLLALHSRERGRMREMRRVGEWVELRVSCWEVPLLNAHMWAIALNGWQLISHPICCGLSVDSDFTYPSLKSSLSDLEFILEFTKALLNSLLDIKILSWVLQVICLLGGCPVDSSRPVVNLADHRIVFW